MRISNYTFSHHKNYLYSKPVKGLRGYEVGYGFGFNGKEKDDEVNVGGGSYDFGDRICDVRLGGRFFSLDPLSTRYPYLSPYCFAANNPIKLIDENGEGPGEPLTGYYDLPRTNREIGFFFRHPIYAAKIGFIHKDEVNISSNAARFAVNSGLNDNSSFRGT